MKRASPKAVKVAAASQVVLASKAGAKLDSNLLTGGGTDDTDVLQSILDRAGADSPLHLIVDGPALVRGLEVHSYTTLECRRGGGFYLCDNSDHNVIRNANRSRDAIVDEYITLKGCFINGNRENQISTSGSDSYSHSIARMADGSFKSGIQFLGVNHLRIENVVIYDARAFGSLVANANFVEFRNVRVDFGWPNPPTSDDLEALKDWKRAYLTSNDGLHFVGPVSNLTIDGAVLRTGDDGIALNANDGVAEDIRLNDEFGPYVGQGSITDVVIRDINFVDAANGIRLLSRNQRIDRVTISELAGTVNERFLVISSWMSRAGSGDVGTVTIEKVNVNPNRFPNRYETTPKFLDADYVATLSLEEVRFMEEDFDYPMFSINTIVENVVIQGVQTKAADSRPIVSIGKHARIGFLKIDLAVSDPLGVANPFVVARGAQVERVEYELVWLHP